MTLRSILRMISLPERGGSDAYSFVCACPLNHLFPDVLGCFQRMVCVCVILCDMVSKHFQRYFGLFLKIVSTCFILFLILSFLTSFLIQLRDASGFCPSIVTCLRPRLPYGLLACGPPCSLFIWLSVSVHRRHVLPPRGDETNPKVYCANVITENCVALPLNEVNVFESLVCFAIACFFGIWVWLGMVGQCWAMLGMSDF